MTPEQANSLTVFERELLEEMKKLRWALELMTKALEKATDVD